MMIFGSLFLIFMFIIRYHINRNEKNCQIESTGQKKSIISIQLENNTIEVDVANSYDNFSNIMSELKNKNEKIININFADKNLENMFLSLTTTLITILGLMRLKKPSPMPK